MLYIYKNLVKIILISYYHIIPLRIRLRYYYNMVHILCNYYLVVVLYTLYISKTCLVKYKFQNLLHLRLFYYQFISSFKYHK